MIKVKFITLGCKVNQYDTQSMREGFVRVGFKEINNGSKADIYVINTCTVTANADRKSRYRINYAYRRNPKARIIVTGCYAELDSAEIAKIPGVTRIIKNKDKDRILDFIDKPEAIKRQSPDNRKGISNFSGHTRAFIKIQDGCNNFCSYCKVPFVRGASRSKPLDKITLEANRVVENGFKEIVLCGICLGSYGRERDLRQGLIDVIEALEKIDGLLRIRLSSIEASDVSDELIHKIAESGKLCRHLHIPIQSGDDEILKRMNRNYSRKDYLDLVKRIKRCVPEIAITTDVMVGFPGESEDNFRNTLDLIREISPLRAHIFPYSKRQGTAASVLEDEIDPFVVKKRINLLKSLVKKCSHAYRMCFLNKKREVLIEERSKENKGHWEGYTDNYIKVIVQSRRNLKNQLIRVRLKNINGDYIKADLS